MGIIKFNAFFALLVLIGLGTTATAQMSGTNYGVPVSGPIGGGGFSSSGTSSVVGLIPLGAGGASGAVSYTVTGGGPGIFAGEAAMTANYAGPAVDTVAVVSRTLKVAYSGGDGPAAGAFFHRQGGATGFEEAPMMAGTGDTMIFNVPANYYTARGLEFYFVIERGTSSVSEGNAASPFVSVCELTNAQCQRPDALPDASYRIIGLPIVPHTSDITAVFPDDLGDPNPTQWRLGRYDPGIEGVVEYPDCESPVPGRAYWLIARGSKRYGTAGFSLRPNRSYGGNYYYEVPLDMGWNQLANPCAFDISWAEVLFDDNGTVVAGHPSDVLDDFAYYYNGSGYVDVPAIGGWDGVFVFIKKTGIAALVRYRESGKGVAKPLTRLVESPSFNNWEIHLELKSGGFVDNGNIVGVREDAENGSDQYDFAEPPPAPGAPQLAFRIPGERTYPRRTDYRAPYADGATWETEFSLVPDRVLTVTGLDKIPGGLETWLILDNNSAMQLIEGEPIELADNVSTARLIVSNKEYLSDEADVNLPLDYSLQQNYPNPFNGATSISFTVKEPIVVNLGVYNIIGQRIKTLINTSLNTGEYTASWNGTDEDGEEVASGIYFYRMTAGEYIRCRKMVFLK